MTVVDEVRGYYDASTARFERFGQGGATLHRAVWGEAVRSRDEAFRYVDELIWRELEPLTHEAVHVLDLGCGVGSSLLFLASRAPIRATGATLGGVQAERARERARDARLDERVRFVEANFLALPSSVEPPHLRGYGMRSLIGGDALQRALMTGLLEYRFMVWRKRGEHDAREVATI